MTPDVETLIARLRGAHPDMEVIFQNGSCWELYEILRVIWPEAEPWYAADPGHVYVKIGHWWYDIQGRCRKPPDNLRPMTTDKYWPADAPHRWSRRTHLRTASTATRIIDGSDL